MMKRISRRRFVAFTASAAAAGNAQTANQTAPVRIRDNRGVVDVEVAGKPFAVYNYDSTQAGVYRPFFYPIMGPNGRPITQNGEFPGTLRGHYWHRSLFVAHQNINGTSFWEERQADCGKIVHLKFAGIRDGVLVEELAWRDFAGRDVLHETRTMLAAQSGSGSRLLDIAIRLEAVRDNAVFSKTPYNLLACRVINAMCLTATKERYARQFGPLVDFSPLNEGGRIVNSEGKENDACRGERAKWCDFSGPLGDGTWGGIALLDHPANPRHPTPWHNWDNMTITASFTFHEAFTLKAGEQLALAYRAVVHAGDAGKADINAEWKNFSQSSMLPRMAAETR